MPREQPVPPEFLVRYDAERAAILRRRAITFCIAILALTTFAWVVTAIDLLVEDAFPDSPDTSSADIVFNAFFTLAILRALVFFVRPRTRAEIVLAFQWLIFFFGFTGTVLIALLRHASWSADSIPLHTPDDDLAQGIASLFTLFALHFFSSLLVALSPREGIVPLVPVLAAFIAWVLFASVGSIEQKLALIILTPVAALPGFAWSWWRYRSFNERFHARAITKRYAEVTRELIDARRVHEALFPPPITRGPIRLTYSYQPMREIGGDFLFVRPLAFPPSAPSGPILVVLIDVTGHGIAAALAVNRLHSEIEHLCAGGVIPRPRDVIIALNTFVAASLASSTMFATAIALRIEPGPAPTLCWSGAGHPPAFLRRTHGTVDRLPSTAPMLGVLEPELFDVLEGTAELGEGDSIIAYTDGASEAADAHGSQIGIDGLERVLREGPRPDLDLAATLADTIAEHRAGEPMDDTLIVEVAVMPA